VTDTDHGGAALSIWVEGQPVVETQTGVADARTGRPWAENTLTATFSCTKGIASLLVAMLIDRGAIPSLEVPLSTIWPDFGTPGKGEISLGDALAHRAGVSAPRQDLALNEILDGVTLAAALAAQEPLWPPGTHHQYHTMTHGVITEQVVARVTGRSIGRFLADEVAGPLDADMWIGLPEREHH
jgi:CubicO group peptidase (beta-lactamase class C family)